MKGCYKVGSVEETWRLAAAFAEELSPGEVICLEGDLGAGKTTFTQGLASALGLGGRVTSPTFCLVQEHAAPADAKIPMLVHMDLYRLNSEDDVLAIGWEDYLEAGAVLIVEWPERAGSLIPASARHIVFTRMDGEEDRQIRFN